MASLQRAQTGNRVYRGAGQSPNMGQVSARGAQGYIQREMRNRNQGGVVRPVGKDGKSDSRSGVASRALNNNLGNNIPRGQARGGPAQKGQRSGLASKPAPAATPVGAQPTAPTVPQIKVNDKGLLELPYSQNLSLSALEALKGSNEELLNLQTEEQQMALQAAQMRRDTDNQYNQLKTDTLSSNASGGTAYSSMYGKAVSDNATAYTNTLGDIQRQETEFTQQASARRAAIQSALAQQLAQDAQANAVDLSDDAGTLGYGNYTAPTNAHGPAKHPERHGNKGNKNKGNKGRGKSGGGPVKGRGKK